jgi:Gnt-I system high-affinity gluconate transporter
LGIIVSIPAIILGGPIFSKTLKNIKTGPLKLFDTHKVESSQKYKKPGKVNSVISAPSIVMLLSLIIATYTLGIRQGRSIKEIMAIYTDGVKDISMILLIIAGSGIFKEVMETSGVNLTLANAMENLPVHPLILGWMMAGIIRGCVGSATVAALTAGGVILPLASHTGVNPNLMILSLGAGSLLFSHVNDSGFWLFKEYFNLSIKDTLRSWSIMEIIVSVAGLLGVLGLSLFIK